MRMSDSVSTPIYFTSLNLHNVRSFGESQELSLIDKDGRLARWTLVIGENGVGKTTLLQCLTRMQPVFNKLGDDDEKGTSNPVEPELASEDKNYVLMELVRKRGSRQMCLEAHLVYGISLQASHSQLELRNQISTKAEIILEDQGQIEDIDFDGLSGMEIDFREPLILAYGAGRYPTSPKFERTNESKLTQSLFEDITRLPDAELRLYQLDYSASKKQSGAEKILRVYINCSG